MNNADLPSSPSRIDVNGDTSYHAVGLSKREHFASMFMQGLLSDKDMIQGFNLISGDPSEVNELIAKGAIQAADALLKELEK